MNQRTKKTILFQVKEKQIEFRNWNHSILTKNSNFWEKNIDSDKKRFFPELWGWKFWEYIFLEREKRVNFDENEY